MKFKKLLAVLIVFTVFSACETPKESSDKKESAAGKQGKSEMSVTEVPEKIKEAKKNRGEQDQAKPELIVESPKEGATINSSTVKVKVKVAGDLRGLKKGKDASGAGNHVHVILDNQPYGAHYMWDEGFELRNVSDGKHTLRMFVSRPWHESYKNEKAFKTITFMVKNGKSDKTKPTTDDKGNKMADPKSKEKKAEGVEVKESSAGSVDFSKPLLTYSRPKGKYEGDDADAIMIDFWLSNAKLTGDGGKFKVRYTINDNEPEMIEKWSPLWIKGWKDGNANIKLELVDGDGKLVENGGYNSTVRSIEVSK